VAIGSSINTSIKPSLAADRSAVAHATPAAAARRNSRLLLFMAVLLCLERGWESRAG
jgi:hypothetical protein